MKSDLKNTVDAALAKEGVVYQISYYNGALINNDSDVIVICQRRAPVQVRFIWNVEQGIRIRRIIKEPLR